MAVTKPAEAWRPGAAGPAEVLLAAGAGPAEVEQVEIELEEPTAGVGLAERPGGQFGQSFILW